jgi:hypothetical protein
MMNDGLSVLIFNRIWHIGFFKSYLTVESCNLVEDQVTGIDSNMIIEY